MSKNDPSPDADRLDAKLDRIDRGVKEAVRREVERRRDAGLPVWVEDEHGRLVDVSDDDQADHREAS